MKVLLLLFMALFLMQCVQPIEPSESSEQAEPTESSSEEHFSSFHEKVPDAENMTLELSGYGNGDTILIEQEGVIQPLQLSDEEWSFAKYRLTAEGYYTKVGFFDSDTQYVTDLDPFIVSDTIQLRGVLYHKSTSRNKYCYSDFVMLKVVLLNGDALTVRTDAMGRYEIPTTESPIKHIEYNYDEDGPEKCWSDFEEDDTCDSGSARETFTFDNEDQLKYLDLYFVEPEMVYSDAPYIYLYPDTTTEVSVSLTLYKDAVIYLSEPTYNEGWNVTATPEGILDDTYHYLFYELYMPTEHLQTSRGWTIARETMDDDLEQLLIMYGLNQQERQDFYDYWLPHFQNASYYNFFPQDMEAYAELVVSPQPESIRRVLFYVAPTDYKPNLLAPEIPDPFIRNGFSVMEWGVLNYHEILKQ